MSKRVLITAAKEDIESALKLIEANDTDIMHLPLEKYILKEDEAAIKKELDALENYENIVLGNKRNAAFFLRMVNKYDKTDAVRGRVNLTMNEETSDLLEAEGIPAICTYAEKKPIDLIEFMLRLQRFGATLYPCGSHKTEEVPGFLVELDIEVNELELFDLKGPDKNELADYQKKIKAEPPEIIVFHSRRSVTRTLAAFENLNLKKPRLVSADKGISRKLEENGIKVDAEAEGSWESIAELI
ncbi:MAG: uroporphyrinogen-III synthase [Balneolaceae bacterium]|nr:uroporphyrinogen-III synthase [Balneolaceae bacterium]